MDVFRQDLLFALRVLRRDRAYAAAVILTLAICLGANTAIFTVVRSVLQRPLPYPESSRLLSSFDGFPGAGVERAGTSVPNYMDRRAMTDIFSSVALYQWWGYKFGQGAGSEQVSAMNVTPSFFKVLGANAPPRPAPQRGRGDARQEQGGGAQPGVCGQAARRARRRRRSRHPPQRRALQGRRRAARVLQLPQPRGPRLHAARLQARGARRGSPLEPEPRDDRPARAGRLDSAGPVEARRPERPLHRAGRRAGGAAAQCRLQHQAELARGRPRAQRALRAADAVGWRALRRPHRGGQHRQPVAGARQRPHEGAGDAQRDRRRRPAHRQAADHRGDLADADRRRPGHRPRLPEPQRHRVDRLHRPAPGARDQPRRRGAGGDAGAGGPARDRRRRRPGAATRPRQLEQRAARRGPLGYRRPHLEGGPPLARGRAGRARLRPADRRRPAAGQLRAPARCRSGLRRGERPDRPPQPARHALQGRQRAARLHGSRADADPRAAGHRSGRRQQLSAVQLGWQQLGGHPGRLYAEARRIGGLAESAVRHGRLLRGDEDPPQERPLLQRVRHGGRAEVGDRRREPGAEVLAEPGCGRQAHLHAGFSRGRGAPRSQGHLDDRRRRHRRGQDEGARRGWRDSARRRLLRRDGAA